MSSIKLSHYQVINSISLSKIDTQANLNLSKEELKQNLKETRKQLADFQNKMYAHHKYAVLICIQGMDTAGKDSLIREVFKDLNARGVVVHSFKTPSKLEKSHDYLWRHYIALPERGKFSVFNRTHYENVLVTRVHPEYILSENLPNINSIDDVNEKFWERRFQEINNFEEHISNNGTIVFKFFLHISKEEQRLRLLRRLEKPEKNWKFSAGDLKERALWDNYQSCYQDAINNTSSKNAPWYIIPSDNKKESRLILASILYKRLKEYKEVQEPVLSKAELQSLEIHKQELLRK